MGVFVAVETFSVDMPDPFDVTTSDIGVSVTTGPELKTGDIVADNVTFPENPLRLISVSVEVTALPLTIVRLVGLAEIEKSITLTDIVKEWDSPPATPVSVIV